MKTLRVVLLAGLALSCHFDKLLNDAGGGASPWSTQLVFTQPPSQNAVAGELLAVQVTARDSAGNTMTSYDGLVTVALGENPAGGSLKGTLDVTAVGGVATFSDVRIEKAGTGYKLRATADAMNGATSEPFGIVAGPPQKLVFTEQPSNTMANSDIQPPVRVTAFDEFDNKATNFTRTLQVRIGDNGGIVRDGQLSGSTSRPVVAGEATFPDLRIDEVGNGYTLIAEVDDGSAPNESARFNITPLPGPGSGPATRLAFTQQPQSTEQGTVMPAVQVTAQNASGAPVSTFTDAITIALNPNPTALEGGPKTVKAANGVATFSGLRITQAGTDFRLTATGGGFSVTSALFNIFAPAPTTGNLTVTTSTSGPDQAPNYTVTVDGGQNKTIPSTGSVSYPGLTAANHTVALSGVPSNCAVSPSSSQTVTVPAGGNAPANFTITCTAVTGSLTVTTSTSGLDLDLNGYTVTLDGTTSRSIDDNTPVTFTGLGTGSHTVELSGEAPNCRIGSPNPRNVTVSAGGNAPTGFTITCTALPNTTPSVNAGSDESFHLGLLGVLTYELNWSFSDPDNGPWNYTINWGHGTPTTGAATGPGAITHTHSYPGPGIFTTYTITVTVTDSRGASGSHSKTVTVLL